MFEALNRILDLVPEALYPIHDFQEASGSNISATSSLATANSSSSESVSRDSSSQNNLGGHLEDNNNSESESFSEMGNTFSPDANVEATLYYFEGRGLADQIRWLLAYTGTSFKQRAVNTRSKFVALMGSGLLSFDQMPLLQIDGLNLVQSQAIVRYVGRRAGLQGKTPQEEAEVDMVAEAIRDCLGMLVGMPFKRADSTEEKASKDTALLKWHKSAPKFEKRLASSENASLVGAGPTYAGMFIFFSAAYLFSSFFAHRRASSTPCDMGC